ncbi:MFS transporter [Rhodobacteraceae bacterium]|nr:MFS transporter [Paracoccaceae bacterium]
MRISTPEFIALMAMLVATVALSIDGMLPALPHIAAQLSPESPNQAQLILSSFVVGMALGTFFMGPLSDSFGRKRIIYFGAGLYVLSAAVCMIATSLETMFIARLLQGIGAAGPRVISHALVRDLYSGREMARISSFIMVVFALVPAMAPLIGAGVMLAFEWQAIFAVFIVFVVVSTSWMGLRITEPITAQNRVPFRFRSFNLAVIEILSLAIVRTAILTLVFSYAVLFTGLLLIQPVFDHFFDRAASFPVWFALIAVCAASASFVNAMLVMQLGMRRLVSAAFRVQVVWSFSMLLLLYAGLISGPLGFGLFVFWVFGIFFQAGMTMGNLTALAMEPFAHIAGTAASVVSAVATLGSVILAGIAGQFFNGTPTAMMIGVAVFACCGLVSAHRLQRYDRHP